MQAPRRRCTRSETHIPTRATQAPPAAQVALAMYRTSLTANLPYGDTYYHHSTNRYSNGRLVINFVAQSLSLPYLPPYLHIINSNQKPSSMGVNFAVAGSIAIIHNFVVKNNLTLNITPQSLQTQLTWFNNFLES
ncbi:GDSL esterase/lipase [Camellia lanceoleosa]|uniref:GDSL esterase/lipase n=1 Tax=Camellia lanceoleosa TaxID=1840588 RepID=A0ACC0FYT6_9ERIC|nr:GDSL esterase/lipase [Camellia lanceoleosa]